MYFRKFFKYSHTQGDQICKDTYLPPDPLGTLRPLNQFENTLFSVYVKFYYEIPTDSIVTVLYLKKKRNTVPQYFISRETKNMLKNVSCAYFYALKICSKLFKNMPLKIIKIGWLSWRNNFKINIFKKSILQI